MQFKVSVLVILNMFNQRLENLRFIVRQLSYALKALDAMLKVIQQPEDMVADEPLAFFPRRRDKFSQPPMRRTIITGLL